MLFEPLICRYSSALLLALWAPLELSSLEGCTPFSSRVGHSEICLFLGRVRWESIVFFPRLLHATEPRFVHEHNEVGCKWDEKCMHNKSWADVCGGVVLSNSYIMHVMNQEKNVETIDVWELKEHEWWSKNIVFRGIREESMGTLASLRKAMVEFLSMHYGMSDVNVHGAH